MHFFILLFLCYGLSITNINAMAKNVKHRDDTHQGAAKASTTQEDVTQVLALIKEEKFNKIIANELCTLSQEKIDADKEWKIIKIIGILTQKLNFSRNSILYGLIYLENLLLQNQELIRDFNHISQHFIVCCLLAIKTNEDKFRSNKFWASVFYNHFCKPIDQSEGKKIQAIADTLEIINALEILILTSVNWKMSITSQQLTAFVATLSEKYKDLLADTPIVYRSYKKVKQKEKVYAGKH